MRKKYSNMLIWLCWLVYSCSYIGKINYTANINLIESFYNVSHSEAGLVSTFFFFAYGIGQVVHGLLCKKYNLRWMIFASLLVSGITNVLVGITTNFAFIKFLWLINGFSVSVLWPSLIRLLSETLAKEEMKKASMVMGTTVGVGTLVVYSLSAVFVTINFKIIFYVATAIFFVVAALWMISFSPLVKRAELETEQQEFVPQYNMETGEEMKKTAFNATLIWLSVVVLGFYGVATNLIKDGLTTWVPTILKEQYHLDDSLSIILTLALPIVAIFGNALAIKMNNKIPDFVLQCAVCFLVAGCIIGGVIGGISLNQFLLTVVGFAIVCLLVSSCNSVITGIFPLFMKGKINSGKTAGLLNGCCYLGSTISSYGLGWVADNFGWLPVFWLLLGVCMLVCVGAVLYVWLRKKLSSSKTPAEYEIEKCKNK